MRTRRRLGRQRAALANRSLVRLVLGHFAAVVAEWAAIIGVLVYAFDHGGTVATGLASIGMLVAGLIVAPFAGWLVDRRRPQRVRFIAFVIQCCGYGAAAAAAYADLPVAAVVGAAVIALGSVTVLRPSAAVLVPAHARSSSDLVVGNLWLWYCESFSVLAGPLLTTVLLELGLFGMGGPSAVLAGCAVAAFASVGLSLFDFRNDPPPSLAGIHSDDDHDGLAFVRSWRALRDRPGLRGVLVVVWAQYVMVGALDLLLVVMARRSLDLGPAGPGVLSTLFGAGTLLSVFIATFLLRRARLASPLAVGLLLLAVAFTCLGVTLSLVAAAIVLPVLGLSRSLLDGPSRMLLQRSAGPEALGSLFAVREVCASAGLIVGSLFAQAVLAFSDVEAALIGLGIFFAVVLVAVLRPLRVVDASADVPVVEMSLLRRLSMFSSLPPLALEALARAATPLVVGPGTVLITQGESGDQFYAVVDGVFDVEMSGIHMRRAERLSFFGEVALLVDVPRTATVTASSAGALLVIDRVAFLTAVTGTDSSRQAAWGVVRSLTLEQEAHPGEGFAAGANGDHNDC